VNTEITDNNVEGPAGWIFYDAGCVLCVRARERVGRLCASRGFQWLPLQTPGTAARLGVPESAFELCMHVLLANGRVFHNADALGILCRSVWWLWPLGMLLCVPGFRELGRLAYDTFARNRYCFGGACRVAKKGQGGVELVGWLVAILLPVMAGFIFWNQPPWLLMWALAFGLGFGLKWLMWRDALAHGACPSARRAFAWFVLWPGLDGRAFLVSGKRANQPTLREWLWAAVMTVAAAILIWGVVPVLLAEEVLSVAWMGMIGIVLGLHFGLFRLCSILCRHFGVKADPIMNAPLRATSLLEFWSTRWNTAFSIAARRLVLIPLSRRIGLRWAGFMVFLMSSVLHEIVISLPVKAGYGLPTLYFVLQGAGVALQRSRVGRKWRLGEGIQGWLCVIFFVVGPLYWLFHPAFAQRVIVPFLKVLNPS
jgi:alginate O-acetyltransferase complex protein AlgI